MSKILSAEERKRQRELEEARKAGLAAPEVCPDVNYYINLLLHFPYKVT
jgi:hypothetical protein